MACSPLKYESPAAPLTEGCGEAPQDVQIDPEMFIW